MATKPNIVLARFADTLAANVVNPPSGSRDTGYVAGDPLDEGVANALALQYYRWFQYLDDGALSGNHSIAGNLAVTGTAVVDGLITANAGMTCAANQHVTVSGTGRHKHGDMILHVPLAAGSGSGWAWDAVNGYLLSSGAGSWSVGAPTVVGWTLRSFVYEVWGDGAADLSGSFNRRPKNSTPDAPIPLGNTNPPASWADTPIDISPDKTISDGDCVWFVFTANAANLRLGDVRLTYAMA